MKRNGIMLVLSILTFTLTLGLITAQSVISAEGKDTIGKIIEIKGKADIIRDGEKLDAHKERNILLKDTSETEKVSRLNILLIEDSLLILDEISRLSFDKYSRGDEKRRGESILFLSDGRVRAKTCNNMLEIYTPLATASAVYRTTDFAVWETSKNGKRTFCLAVLKDPNKKIAIVDFKNEKGSVRVPEGYMSCVVDGSPTEPMLIPEKVHKELLELKGVMDWECRQTCVEGEAFREDECVPVLCNECERLNPQGVCIPDNCKPCDDGNPCTIDDHCLGRKCKGRKDPSPTDPSCLE